MLVDCLARRATCRAWCRLNRGVERGSSQSLHGDVGFCMRSSQRRVQDPGDGRCRCRTRDPDVRDSARPDLRDRADMSGADLFGLIVSVIVCGYLLYALLRGEKF